MNNPDDLYAHFKARGWSKAQIDAQKFVVKLGGDLAGIEPNLDWAETMTRREDGRSFKKLDPRLWSAKQMYEQVFALKKNLDLSRLDPNQWGVGQMQRQRWALEEGCDLSNLDPKQWDAMKMEQQRHALREGYDLSQLNASELSWMTIMSHLLALKREAESPHSAPPSKKASR